MIEKINDKSILLYQYCNSIASEGIFIRINQEFENKYFSVGEGGGGGYLTLCFFLIKETLQTYS